MLSWKPNSGELRNAEGSGSMRQQRRHYARHAGKVDVCMSRMGLRVMPKAQRHW